MKIKKAKLIWKRAGYKVDFCNWEGYYADKRAIIIVHDLFEHSPTDVGDGDAEIRATGAKLKFDGVVIFTQDGQTYFDNASTYKSNGKEENVVFHSKGRRSINKLVKTYENRGINAEKSRALFIEGFEHAKQYRDDAYHRVLHTNFERYHKQKLDLEISLVTGRILKKIPKST